MALSEWLHVMLAEIARKREEGERAREEQERRSEEAKGRTERQEAPQQEPLGRVSNIRGR